MDRKNDWEVLELVRSNGGIDELNVRGGYHHGVTQAAVRRLKNAGLLETELETRHGAWLSITPSGIDALDRIEREV